MRSYVVVLLIFVLALSACSLKAPAEVTGIETTATPSLVAMTPTLRPTFTTTPTSGQAEPSVAVQAPSATATKQAATATHGATATKQAPTTQAATSTLSPAQQFEPMMGIITGTLVNLRSEASLSAEIVGRLGLSDTVELIGPGQSAEGNWWELRDPLPDVETAWVFAEFVALPDTNDAVLAQLNINQQITPTPTPTDAPLTSSSTLSLTGRVTATLVNLRSEASLTAEIVSQVRENDVLTLLERDERGEWWRVVLPDGESGESAWIFAEFLVLDMTSRGEDESIVGLSADQADTITTTNLVAKTATSTPEVEPNTTPNVTETPAPEPQAQTFVPSAGNELPALGGFGPPGGNNPLTSLPLSAEKQNQRPVIACINNDFAARPQFGTSNADVMYEYLMEGYGITRFSGIFYGDNSPQIGPIRSARLINYYMGALYNAPIFCSGASDQVRFILKNQSPVAYLDVDLDDPSNANYSDSIGTDYRTRLRTNTTYQRQWLQDWGIEEPASVRGFSFGPLPGNGSSGTNITIPYPSSTGSQVSYLYNIPSGKYLRYLGGVAHSDGNTGTQLALDNVVVQYVAHQATDIVEDSLGSTSIRLNLFGSGTAIVFRQGQAFVGTWRSESRGDLPRFYDESGAEISLKPGKTWISIVPSSYEIVYQ